MITAELQEPGKLPVCKKLMIIFITNVINDYLNMRTWFGIWCSVLPEINTERLHDFPPIT